MARSRNAVCVVIGDEWEPDERGVGVARRCHITAIALTRSDRYHQRELQQSDAQLS